MRVDVVREGEDRLHVEAIPLHRDLDGALLFLALEVDDVLVDRVLRRVDVRDEVPDAAVVLELDPLAAGALVGEDDVHALGEERGLAQALGEDLGVPLDPVRENLRVREEADDGARALSDPDLLELGLGLPTRELLAVDLAVAMDVGDQPFGERVHDRDADAVQPAGHLVPVAAELSACVELRQDDRQRRQPLLLHNLDGDPAAVIRDRHGVVRMDDDLGVVVVPGEGLIDSIVDHLEHEMVETSRAGRADVHPGPEPDRLETLEDGDVFCGVGRFSHAGVTKKALQIPRFRAELSLSERAVGRSSCEACRSRSGDELPQLRIVYLCSNFSRSGPVGRGRGGRNSSLFPDVLCTRFRQRAGREAQTARLGLAERVREARGDLRLELRELEGPRRRADRYVQRSIPSQPRRPRVRGDRVAHDLRPRGHDLGHSAGGAEAGEARCGRPCRFAPLRGPRHSGRHLDQLVGRRRERIRGRRRDEALTHPATRSPASAAVSRRARTERRRATAAAGRERSLSSSASPSKSARTDTRCSPCEPKRRRSRPPARIAMSCRCGPSPSRRARDRVGDAPRALPLSEAPPDRQVTPPRARVPPHARRTPARAARASPRGQQRARHRAPRRAGPWGESVPDESEAATRLSAAFRWPTAAAYSTGSVARAGKSRASTRSKYARRTTGEPLTIDEPVGREHERRHLSAQLLGGPQRGAVHLAFFPPVAEASRRAPPASVPARPAARSGPHPRPRRITSASLRVRGENPCEPTCTASSRFVFPTPFGPTIRTRPGRRSRSSRSYERMARSETWRRSVSPPA